MIPFSQMRNGPAPTGYAIGDILVVTGPTGAIILRSGDAELTMRLGVTSTPLRRLSRPRASLTAASTPFAARRSPPPNIPPKSAPTLVSRPGSSYHPHTSAHRRHGAMVSALSAVTVPELLEFTTTDKAAAEAGSGLGTWLYGRHRAALA